MRLPGEYIDTRLHGFSLTEIVIVLLIVAILTAVVAPMMQPRVRQAKWVEGMAGAGALATGIRTYCIEAGRGHPAIAPGGDFSIYQVYQVELTGKYFRPDNYSVSEVIYDEDTGRTIYLITVTAPGGVGGTGKTLDQDGQWQELTSDGGGT